MKFGKIKDGHQFKLPVDATTQALAFLGRRGSGKTFAATKLAELLHAEGAQFVAIDPVGVWWGLRLAANGKDAGIDIPIFGGLHGDIPLEATGGALVADVVVDRGLSTVLDVSQFESDADKARFARDFAARFFFRKKSSPSAVHVFIEEAQEFIPQNIQRGEEQMLHAFQRMIRLGRNYGIGVSMVSQRPQDVNKKALNQTECLFCFQLTGPQERKAVEDWASEKGLSDDLGELLPLLKQGRAHTWSPVWLEVNEEVHVDEKWTYAAGSTPKVGERPVSTKPLAPIELEQLGRDMAATIERAKAEDPKHLRAELAKLKAQISARPTETKNVEIEKRVDVPVLKEGQLGRIEALATKLQEHGEKCLAEADAIRQTIKPVFVRPTAQAQRPPLPRVAPPRRLIAQATAGNLHSESNGDLPDGERRILTAIAQYDDGVERDQLTILTGYKRSTRDAYVQRLNGRGFVDIGVRLRATPEGVSALGDSFEPLPTGEALRDYWMNKLPDGERAILGALLESHPDSVDREVLTELTGYKRSTRDAYLQRLGSRRLVESDRGAVRASGVLFS